MGEKEDVKIKEQETKEVTAQDAVRLLANFKSLLANAHRFKSLKRHIRRHPIGQFETIAEKRPFNNRANTSTRKGVHSRVKNEEKRRVYEGIKRAAAKQSV